ncbi:hypothetical protein AC249_AIPGENE14582 [Exaiptasia diaphana]|nr:hypothetical protein AC249_AIPGENE14582 [Exaiptasia diaphana]
MATLCSTNKPRPQSQWTFCRTYHFTYSNLAITPVEMGRLSGLVLLCLLNAVVLGAMKCPHYDEPKNGYLTCKLLTPGPDMRCEAKCNKGYKFDGAVASFYLCFYGRWLPVCPSDSTCPTTLPWPDCIKSG